MLDANSPAYGRHAIHDDPTQAVHKGFVTPEEIERSGRDPLRGIESEKDRVDRAAELLSRDYAAAEAFIGNRAVNTANLFQGKRGEAVNIVESTDSSDVETGIYALSIEEIRKLRRTDYAVTAACLIGDQITIRIPDFHYSVWNELHELSRIVNRLAVGYVQKVWTVPREHSKTTTIKLAILTILRETNLSFLLYASNTQGMALNAIRDIVDWLRSPGEERIWGKTYVVKKNESEGLWILKIPLQNGELKTVIFKAVGVMQQIRGLIINNKRPDLQVFDDIEGISTADSGPNQKKLDEWFFGDALKCAAKRALRVVIGNLIRDTTLLARLCKLPSWNPTRFGALVRNGAGELVPLWPGRHTVESLLQEYREHRALGMGHVWESEMMNMSRDLTMADSIPDQALTFVRGPEDVEHGFVIVDPAFGKDKQHDESALTVHVKLRGQSVPVLVDSRKGHWTEEQLFDQIMELVIYWGLPTVGIEAIAAQRLLIPLFRSFMVIRQMDFELMNFVPLVGQNTPGAKASRIKAFRDLLIGGDYLLEENQIEFKTAIEKWSPETAVHDDLPDSGSLAPIMWAEQGEIIKQSGGRVATLGQRLFEQNAQDFVEEAPRHLVTM